ncbi:hypothetical protein QTG54_014583 [Skeletonema marinoi]|uniref:Nucleolar protein 16 n=1 Tax=Skeletonema marinoi TaxID=267567 RepID=A0AAD8XWG3_9STRA|nr:hypothetical protein QTG54_014583 [Skeletonema marinoi]
MVKHGATKKRRSGRAPPNILDKTVRAMWNPRKSPAQNMSDMGLQSGVNSSIDKRAECAKEQWKAPEAKPDGSKAIELFDIPQTNSVNVSIEDQKYIRKCLAKHGDDYKRMTRDIKTNDMQHTQSKLKNMAENLPADKGSSEGGCARKSHAFNGEL